MIEVDIPSIDPIQHEPKLIFGLTFRQACCVIIGGTLAVGAFLALQFIFNVPDLSVLGFLVFALPAVLMGWYKPFNLKAEDYAKLVWYNNFVASPTRILKTDLDEDIPLPTLKQRQEMERKLQQQSIKKKKAAAAEKAKQQKKGGRN